jgi:hypothetical protein
MPTNAPICGPTTWNAFTTRRRCAHARGEQSLLDLAMTVGSPPAAGREVQRAQRGATAQAEGGRSCAAPRLAAGVHASVSHVRCGGSMAHTHVIALRAARWLRRWRKVSSRFPGPMRAHDRKALPLHAASHIGMHYIGGCSRSWHRLTPILWAIQPRSSSSETSPRHDSSPSIASRRLRVHSGQQWSVAGTARRPD